MPVGFAPEIEVIIEVIGVPNVPLNDGTEVPTTRGVVNVVEVDAGLLPALLEAATTTV